jgi:hypothetical protein
MKRFNLAVAVLVAGCLQAQQPTTRNDERSIKTPVVSESNLVVTLLLSEFQRQNPAIVRASLTELRHVGSGYVALAWGYAATPPPLSPFRRRFEDQLHVVALLDSTLSRVEHVLDMRPTPRWSDYSFWIDRVTPKRQIIVRGRGSTYGDQPLRLDLKEHLGSEFRRTIAAAEQVRRLTPAAFGQLPAAVRKRLESEGCLVPQSPKLKTPHNVLSGSFGARGQLDWAVVCSKEGETSVLLFWGGLASCPERLGHEFADTEALQDLEWNFVIRRISAAQVRKKEVSLAADHDGIDVGTSTFLPDEKTYTARYCEGGKWLDEGIP